MERTKLKKIYTKIKDGETLADLCQRLSIEEYELMGLVELMNLSGMPIEIIPSFDNTLVINKGKRYYQPKSEKPLMEDLKRMELCVVSDTHLCSKLQQLSLLNNLYKTAYEREITDVLHCGDIVDGDYRNRPEHIYSLFKIGADEQIDYISEMYPEINGITTSIITGSHDETHVKNGGVDLGRAFARNRKDIKYLGQDEADLVIDGIKIKMSHPGGGSAKSLSYKPQQKIESMESGGKPDILTMGHYHKSYYMNYRNVHAFLVGAMVDQSQFMQKNSLANIVGAFFITVYYDEKGIHYISPEEYLYKSSDIKENDYKKCKKLKI